MERVRSDFQVADKIKEKKREKVKERKGGAGSSSPFDNELGKTK